MAQTRKADKAAITIRIHVELCILITVAYMFEAYEGNLTGML